jgi:hypothetical protein
LLPPALESLTITHDLYDDDTFQEESFEDVDAMALFRAYLSGEKLGPHWMESSSDSYVRGLDNWSLGWVQGEPEWKVKTPELRSFTYDLRRGGR